MAQMSYRIGVTPDREQMQIEIQQDGKALGWIGLDAAESDQFMKIFAQYRAMLTDVLPKPPNH